MGKFTVTNRHIITCTTNALIPFILQGCLHSHNTASHTRHTQLPGKPTNEFVSLDHRATIELASLSIGDRTYILDRSNFTETSEGVAILLYDKHSPAVDMQAELVPLAAILMGEDEVRIIVNVDNKPQEVDIHTIDEKASLLISDERVYTAVGELHSQPIRLTYPTSMDGMGTSALSFDEEHGAVSISGTLGTRTYNQLFGLLSSGKRVQTVNLINVTGSINDEINMQTGRLIRNFNLNTYVPAGSTIASGGVDLFCAGTQRFIHREAQLLVHSWGGQLDGAIVSADQLPQTDIRHQQQITYFNEMLGTPMGEQFYWFTIHSASFGEDLHTMTHDEITAHGLVTD